MTEERLKALRTCVADGAQAMVELGKHHLAANEMEHAIFYLSGATALRHPEANLILGHLYLQLEHTAENLPQGNAQKRGVELLAAASESGVDQATELLKIAWGRGVCKEQIEAFFLQVAEQHRAYAEEHGDAESMLQAAIGLQCFSDSAEARAKSNELLKRAASLGNEEAAVFLSAGTPETQTTRRKSRGRKSEAE